jgi:transcriptional regulator with XRE-family HTH domain
MEIEDFLALSGREVAGATQSDEAVWSRYFNGRQLIGERTLVRYAKLLDMSPSSLLDGIRLRREAKASQQKK